MRLISAPEIPYKSVRAIRIANPSEVFSTRYSSLDLLTSTPRIFTPSLLASASSKRFGYIPGSWVNRPARNSVG